MHLCCVLIVSRARTFTSVGRVWPARLVKVKLEREDIVLADQGFIVEEDVALQGPRLKSPRPLLMETTAITEVEISQLLSAVLIHVIGLLNNKYSILQVC